MECGNNTIEASIVFPIIFYVLIIVANLVIVLNEKYTVNYSNIKNILNEYQYTNEGEKLENKNSVCR